MATTLLAGAKTPHGATQNSMGSALSDGRGHCESRSGTESCRCLRGLDVRKLLPRQRREKCFLLTSPFIEPGGSMAISKARENGVPIAGTPDNSRSFRNKNMIGIPPNL
jgi:hypothetical protein